MAGEATSASSESSAEGGRDSGAAVGVPLADDGAAIPSEVSREGVTGLPAGFALSGRDLIRTGWLQLVVEDLARAVAEVRWRAEAHGGFVAEQIIRTGDDDPRRGPVPDIALRDPGAGGASLTVRVPADRYQNLYDELSSLGEVEQQNASTSDVSEAVVDLESRIESGRRSVERLRALLARAETIGDLVQLESELSRREADLESLQAQLAGLSDQVAMSTISVSLRTPTPSEVDDPGPGGFRGGLESGWDAALAAASAVLAVAGFVVPFLPVAAVAGVGGVIALRRHRGHRPAATGTDT